MDSTKEKLIEEHMFLADRLAGKFRKKLPKHISYDELKSAGYMGLIAATKNYDASLPFSKYATCFIHGSIIDYVRKLNNSRRKAKLKFASMDIPDSYENTLASKIEDKRIEIPNTDDFFSNIRKILSERQYEAVENYYIKDMTLVEIGKKMNISWSRVQQLLVTSKGKIKKHIQENKNNRFSFAYGLI